MILNHSIRIVPGIFTSSASMASSRGRGLVESRGLGEGNKGVAVRGGEEGEAKEHLAAFENFKVEVGGRAREEGEDGRGRGSSGLGLGHD